MNKTEKNDHQVFCYFIACMTTNRQDFFDCSHWLKNFFSTIFLLINSSHPCVIWMATKINVMQKMAKWSFVCNWKTCSLSQNNYCHQTVAALLISCLIKHSIHLVCNGNFVCISHETNFVTGKWLNNIFWHFTTFRSYTHTSSVLMRFQRPFAISII